MDAQAKIKTDWEAVERQYRAGVLSVREIARQQGVTDAAIRKRAKVGSWERDLTAKVQEKVRADLVRDEVRTPNARENLRTEREIVESAAATVVTVVREHRRDIATGRQLVSLLSTQLLDVAGHRDTFIDAIEQECIDDESGERRSKLLKAVSLPVHAATIRDLSNAMKNLVALERQAFNVPDVAPEEPEAPAASAAQVDEGFAQLRAAFDKRLNKADDAPAAT